MVIRKAKPSDLSKVAQLYEEIHDEEEAGRLTTGWIRGVYPVRAVAEAALKRGDLFVLEQDGTVAGAALINQIQVDVYKNAPWSFSAPADRVCVLHTLVISPRACGKGLGSGFVRFYEDYARERGWTELRMDTNARNLKARALYRKLGYTEVAQVPTVFNGIPDVRLVLLEKNLGI